MRLERFSNMLFGLSTTFCILFFMLFSRWNGTGSFFSLASFLFAIVLIHYLYNSYISFVVIKHTLCSRLILLFTKLFKLYSQFHSYKMAYNGTYDEADITPAIFDTGVKVLVGMGSLATIIGLVLGVGLALLVFKWAGKK